MKKQFTMKYLIIALTILAGSGQAKALPGECTRLLMQDAEQRIRTYLNGQYFESASASVNYYDQWAGGYQVTYRVRGKQISVYYSVQDTYSCNARFVTLKQFP